MLRQLLSRLRRAPVREITPAELQTALLSAQAIFLIDLRDERQFAAGHLPGAVPLPLDRLNAEAGRLDPTAPTVVYWNIGVRSAQASRELAQRGFPDARSLAGGIRAWRGQIEKAEGE